MQAFLQDLRFALRLLRKDASFTAITVLTLGIGIAITTTVFSWVDSLLLRPYPGATAGDRLAILEPSNAAAPNVAGVQVSYMDYRDFRDNLRTLAGLAAHREEVFQIGEGATVQPLWGELVSGNYFEVLGVKAAAGRLFGVEEDVAHVGESPVVVISDRLWRERFRGAPGVVGKSIRVNQRNLTVIGVAAAPFRGTMPGLAYDLWIPVTMGLEVGSMDPSSFRDRRERNLYALARLAPGVTIAQAHAEATAFSQNLAAAFPETNTGVSASVVPVWQFHAAAPDLLSRPLRILMVVAMLLFLIVCANVANLLLSRSVGRRSEFGVRLALGANRRQIQRQLLTETFVLAMAGAILGLILAPWIADLLPSLIPDVQAPVARDFELNTRILSFATAACVAATLLAGLIPALLWAGSRVDAALRERSRSGGQGLASHRARGALVVAEVALASLALVSAAVFLGSFDRARRLHPGFDPNSVVLARFYLAGANLTLPELQQFCLGLQTRLRGFPGVEAVGYADRAPLGTTSGPYSLVSIAGYVPKRGEVMQIHRSQIGPGYLAALQIPLLEGREFRDSDDAKSPAVIIVNETFARRYFPGGLALGRKVQYGSREATVIGIARDSKYFHVAEPAQPHFFAPFRQRGRSGDQFFFFIRTAQRPGAFAAVLRREVAVVRPESPAADVMTLTAWTEVTMLPQKVTASLACALGLIALVLAAIGLYSVMSYAVNQRTPEIGVRMALGAGTGDVLRNVLERGMVLTMSGLAVGLAASLVTARAAGHWVQDVNLLDFRPYVAAAGFLLLVGLLACFVPARRATKVSPIAALRAE